MERTRGTGVFRTARRAGWNTFHDSGGFQSIGVASGKGGTGKSVLTASLAAWFASQSKKTLLFDADLGVGNAHILQGVSPAYTVAHVVSGMVDLEDIEITAPTGVRLLPGGSGVGGLANLNPRQMNRISQGFAHLERRADVLLVDSGAGVSDQTLRFLLASELALLVATPDLTALTDAYALIKVLNLRNKTLPIGLIVNRTRSMKEALAAANKIRSVAQRFLGKEIQYLGNVPEDSFVGKSVAEKVPFLLKYPNCPASRKFLAIAEGVGKSLEENRQKQKFSQRILTQA